MAKTLNQLIKDAETALGKTEENSSERTVAQAKLDALTSVKESGFGFTQDDLNRVDKKAKEEHEASVKKANDEHEASVKEVLGMTLDEAKEVMAGVEESLVSDEDSPANPGEKDGVGLEALQTALEERDKRIADQDQKIVDLSGSQENFQRRYYTELVTNGLDAQLRTLGLNEKYHGPAYRLIGYDDLIEKAMKGEEVTDEELKAKAEEVKAQASVFFEPERQDDYQGIPPSPNGDPIPELTDQQRLEKATPVF